MQLINYFLYRGHLELLDRVETATKKNPGLYLGGNFKTGVAFGDCVQYGIDYSLIINYTYYYLIKGVDVAAEVGTFLRLADVKDNIEKDSDTIPKRELINSEASA